MTREGERGGEETRRRHGGDAREIPLTARLPASPLLVQTTGSGLIFTPSSLPIHRIKSMERKGKGKRRKRRKREKHQGL